MEGRIRDVFVTNPRKRILSWEWGGEKSEGPWNISVEGKKKIQPKRIRTLQLIEMWYPMAVNYSIIRKEPGWAEPHFCPGDAQEGRAVLSSAGPGHLCWCVPFTAQPGVWHLPSPQSFQLWCHMLIVLYCSSFLVDVISFCVLRIESSKVKNVLLKRAHLKAEEYFSPPGSFCLPCQKFSLVFSIQMSRAA